MVGRKPEADGENTRRYSFVAPPGVDRLVFDVRISRPPSRDVAAKEIGKLAKLRQYRNYVALLGEVTNQYSA